MSQQSLNSTAESVYNGLDVIRKAKKLRTVALTASREHMEDLLPEMINLLQEFDEEEVKLKTQTTKVKSFRRFNSRLFDKAATKLSRSGKRKKKLNGVGGMSDILLLPTLPEAQRSGNLGKIGLKQKKKSHINFSKLKYADNSISSLNSNAKPKKIKRTVSSKLNNSARSLNLLDNKFSPKKHLKILITERKLFKDAIDTIRPKASPIMRRVKERGSICGIYDPLKGDIEWAENNTGGVFGVWHPIQERLIWKLDPTNSVCGVFNPKTKHIEWKTSFNGSVCGVYHPKKEKVVWFLRRGLGIFAVLNPITCKIEVKENPKGGIVGWFDYKTESVHWEVEDGSSICYVVRDYENGGYLTACSNFTGWRR